jgi:hypothetical protein
MKTFALSTFLCASAVSPSVARLNMRSLYRIDSTPEKTSATNTINEGFTAE